jgi:RNA polymerase sigma factor (sigma-70 family)
MSLTPEEAAFFVKGAADGDRAAWESLVDAYGGLIWAITRNHRLLPGDAADVSQTTWLRLLENIERLTDPGRVGAWLATTARRECLRLSARRKRTVLVADERELELDPLRVHTPELDDGLLLAERDEALRAAFKTLNPRCQELLRLMLLDPAPSYEEISAALDMPVGSIGPTRGRCLDKLKALVKTSGIESASARSL